MKGSCGGTTRGSLIQWAEFMISVEPSCRTAANSKSKVCCQIQDSPFCPQDKRDCDLCPAHGLRFRSSNQWQDRG
jgi:hypothetical protein